MSRTVPVLLLFLINMARQVACKAPASHPSHHKRLHGQERRVGSRIQLIRILSMIQCAAARLSGEEGPRRRDPGS